jgi:hypothetical protein
MSRARYAFDPKIAVGRTRDAVVAAGRYSGRNLSELGAEGARRTGGAWTVLRYGPPPSRRRTRSILACAVIAAGAIGAMTVLAVQRGLAARRQIEPDGERATTVDQPAPADLNSSTSPAPEGVSRI